MAFNTKTASTISDQIFNQLDLLGASVNQDPCSGLMTEVPNSFLENNPELILVKIYDDHASGVYDAESVLAVLEDLKGTQDVDDVWGLIAPFEV